MPSKSSNLAAEVAYARDFAVEAHNQQKYGAHPYVYHLDAVARISEPYGPRAQIVAYLHDVTEDASISGEILRDFFGAFVAECVDLLTDPPGVSRSARKALSHAKLAKVKGEHELALVVKAADRLANLRESVNSQNGEMLKKYRAEHETFREAAYRPGLCDELWTEIDALVAKI